MTETIGTRIRALREQRGYTQETVAKVCAITQTGYSAWELGRVDIPTSRLLVLAQFLGVTPDALLLGEQEQESTVHV